MASKEKTQSAEVTCISKQSRKRQSDKIQTINNEPVFRIRVLLSGSRSDFFPSVLIRIGQTFGFDPEKSGYGSMKRSPKMLEQVKIFNIIFIHPGPGPKHCNRQQHPVSLAYVRATNEDSRMTFYRCSASWPEDLLDGKRIHIPNPNK